MCHDLSDRSYATPWDVPGANQLDDHSDAAAASKLPHGRPSARQSAADDRERTARVEAVLFVADRPLSASRIAKAALLPNAAQSHQLIERLNADYLGAGSALRVVRLASGFRLMTRPELSYFLAQIAPKQDAGSLSPALLETATIVAYRQPVTRAEVEAIRGVASLEMLKSLMDRGLVRIVGEDDSLGRPFLYGTTTKFLDRFGLDSLDELPDRDSLAA